MNSFFSPRPAKIVATARPMKDEVYDLRGLNMVTPDQIIDGGKLSGETPYALNFRMFSEESEDQRTAVMTRKGVSRLFGPEDTSDTPLDVESSDPVDGEQVFSSSVHYLSPFSVPSYSLPYGKYCMTTLKVSIKKSSGTIESINVDVRRNVGGAAGPVIASSSFLRTSVTGSFTQVTAYFVDAPEMDSEGDYFFEFYLVGSEDAYCTLEVSSTPGGYYKDVSDPSNPWVSSGNSLVFESPCYRSGTVLGAYRRNVKGEIPTTIMATGHGDLISFDNNGNTSLVMAYAPGYNRLSNKFRFSQVDDRTFFVNGDIQPRYWDGSSLHTLGGASSGSQLTFTWKNRLFFVKDGRFEFTDIISSVSDTENFPPTNFFYVKEPESPDQPVAAIVFQDTLVIFTRETKYIALLQGDSISGLTIREVQGSKGTYSQETIATDNDYVYFLSDDKQMRRFNGVSDEIISDKVFPEIGASLNPELNSYIHIYRNEVKYYYAKSPSAVINRCLTFNVKYEQWYLDTGKEVSRSIEYNLEDNRIVEFSSKTYLAMNGNTGFSDMGKPIDFKYWTAYKNYGSGAAKDRIKRFRPILKILRNFSMLVGKDINFQNSPDMRVHLVSGGGATYGGGAKYGDGSKYGSSKMTDTPVGMSGRGRHTQYRFQKNGVDTPVMLYGYIALFKQGKDK